MTSKKIKYVFLTFVFIITGCKDFSPVQPLLNDYSVTAFITNDTTSQSIGVYRTASLNGSFSQDYFYDKAEIVISGKSDYFPFTYTEDEYGNKDYLNSRPNFKPGEKYNLNLKTETVTITGETTLPGDFEITSYKEGQEIIADKTVELNLNWSRSNNAFVYILNFKFPMYSSWFNDYYYANFSNKTYDTIFHFSDSNALLGLDTTHYSIISVTAIDKNFYRHYFEEYNSVGIDRGYGYFGSGTVKTIKLKIKIR